MGVDGAHNLDDRLNWNTDGRDWPNRHASRFVTAGGLRWHLQQFGPDPGLAPLVLLLHGTGSSTHSWRDVAPLLANRYAVLALDLPGHAFTTMPRAADQSLPGIAKHIGVLLESLRLSPAIVVGHSAGAAIAARMLLDRTIAPAALVSLNGAFTGIPGLAGQFFSPLTRLFASLPLASHLFAWQASDAGMVEHLMRSTGSMLDPAGLKLYGRLVRNVGHVEAALAMMAHWDLEPLEQELHLIREPVWMVAAENDLTVPPAQARQVSKLLPDARLTLWPMLGHLAHEEKPALCARLINNVWDKVGLTMLR